MVCVVSAISCMSFFYVFLVSFLFGRGYGYHPLGTQKRNKGYGGKKRKKWELSRIPFIKSNWSFVSFYRRGFSSPAGNFRSLFFSLLYIGLCFFFFASWIYLFSPIT